MTTATETKSIKFAVIAALTLGAPLEGGQFRGVTTLADGTHAAIVYLETSEGTSDWQGRVDWAAKRGGVLASRAVMAQLRVTAKDVLPRKGWCWTSDVLSDDTGDAEDASYAWVCNFSGGYQYCGDKSAKGAGVAVRLIHLEI
jgi:hypothetical protein